MENKKLYTPPLEKIKKEIDNNSEKIIVLKGEVGSGKSTIQEFLEERNFENQTCTFVNGFLPEEIELPKDSESNELLEHFYELKMTQMLLHFLSVNKLASVKDIIIAQKFRESFEQLKNNDLGTFKKTGEFTEQILRNLKEDFPINNLFIDNFDEYAKTYPFFHKYMKRYFPYFSKVVLTSKQDIDPNYCSIPVRYGTVMSTTREIIMCYLESLNEEYGKQFDYSHIDLETYSYINTKAKGNITLIIEAILQFYNLGNWEHANEKLKEAVDVQVRKRKLTK